MIEFILVYLFFSSCMFAASESESNNSTWIGLLIVSLLWPWFIVTTLFQRIIK
jgi:hypothetical protein